MLERREAHRRRTCLRAAVTSDLFAPPETVQVVDLSATGARIRIPSGGLQGDRLALRLDREPKRTRRARVVWRDMEVFGVRFDEGSTMRCDPQRGDVATKLGL